MRKKLWKKPLAALMLSAALAVTLTACGEEKKDAVSKEVKNEYVYQPSFQTLEGIESISDACMKDGKVYLYESEWVEDKKDKEDGGKTYHYLITCGTDGSDPQKTEMKEFKEDEYPTIFALDDQQQLRMLTQRYKYNPETGEAKQSYFAYTLDAEGKVKDCIELKRDKKKSDQEDYFYLDSRSTVFLNGKIYAGMDTKIYTFDEKGKAGKTYESDGGNYIQSLLQTGEGKLYVYGWMDQGENSKNVFREFDPETGKFGDPIDFGEYSIYNLSVQPAGGSKIFVSDGNNIYTIDLANGKLTTELNWLNSDVDGSNLRGYFPLEDGKFLAVNTVYDDSTQKSTTEFITLNKVKASDVKEKEIITYACADMDYNVKAKILSFNKQNEKYRIELKDYSAYENPSKQLNMDVTTGKIPDILDLRWGISRDQLAKKGVFTDLYPLMEKDEEVKKEDFIPSILSTMEIDGKLYAMPYSFGPQALIASKKIVGDIDSWTMDEMIELYNKMPEGKIFMRYMSRDWFISNIVSSQMKEYVDWSKGEVKFDTDDFIKLIEFSKDFPSSEEIDYNNQENDRDLIKKGKLFLNNLYLYSPQEIQTYTQLYKKGGYTALSYPTSDKNNKLPINLNGCALAITNQCKNKDGAWEFVREFLTYEYQKKAVRGDGFPTRKDALDKILEYAQAKEQYTDEDGTEVYPIEGSYGYDGYDIEMKPLSDEEVETLRSMIDRCGICNTYDTASSDITEIINEELKAYYAGDKTAKDTADVIQSRVKIYVSENS